MPYDANQHELEILKFWQENKIFERSVSERPANKPYVFYDGPPFATGLPHYGHFPSSIMKDVVPRYWTMQGYRVERVWGWDCHGLPIENIVEKELGAKSKKEIEKMGVAKFNELCRSKVLGYVDEWEKTIHRLGRWVDMKHAYRTMDLGYMESVWWVFKQLWDKGLIYKDYKAMHICPRCETTLSQQEVSEGYKEVKDLSVIVKFKLKNPKEKLGIEGNAYLLAWTTTPWTLPGNLLLAVGEDIEYVSWTEKTNETFIMARETFNARDIRAASTGSWTGKDLIGLEYIPPFPYYADTPNAFRVVAGDFVSTAEGTGVVHIAPGYGQDDYKLGKSEGLPVIQPVGMDGRFNKDATDFFGLHVKPIGDHQSTDVEIIKYLAKHEALFYKEKYEHSYPHCWRCDTPLINYATSSWFVAVTKIKDKALVEAKKINWSPAHIKEGRFGHWLAGARDWSISRQRFWASVMPIWICDQNEAHQVVFGSVQELEEKSGKKVDDLHKHILDEIAFPCEKCAGTMRRIPDVLDTWFDSGSMPYAQAHYPFENRAKFEASFPAQFIAEGQDQTRAWFYYLHVLSVALRGAPAFQNVIVNGIVLAEDGKKMSKRLKNYPDPNKILETYGADALRYYLVISPVVRAENLNFSEEGIREVFNKLLNTLWNVVEFYRMYAEGNSKLEIRNSKPTHILDRWIVARLNQVVREVTNNMNEYNLVDASRPIMEFVLDLSQWYVRRSRDRFKGDDEKDRAAATAALREVLLTLAKLTAPFTPFIAEKIYQETTDYRLQTTDLNSVHLEMWPVADEKLIDEPLLADMARARKIVEMGLAIRKEHGIRVRQPLAQMQIASLAARRAKYSPPAGPLRRVEDEASEAGMQNDLLSIVADELNVKEVRMVGDVTGAPGRWVGAETPDMSVALNIDISDELKKEGLLREIARAINQMRKEAKLTPSEAAVVAYRTEDPAVAAIFIESADELRRQTRTKEFVAGGQTEREIGGPLLKMDLV